MGKELINQILEYKNQIKALDAEIKPHIEKLTRLQKAEKELAFLRSEEGKQLLNLQKQIRAVRAEYAEEKAVVDPLVEARKKLAQAQSAEYQELQNVNRELQKQQKIAKLTAIIDNTREDTYERLSAQYALGKIRLGEFTQAELTNTEAGRELVKQLEQVYAKMKLLQESTGYFGLGVGQYNRAFEGLNFSVAQVVRELPSAAMGLNTFFLAISNNIPMVVDEINKLRKAGTSGINILKGIGAAIFSWQTLLVAGLTILSMYGDEIIDWVGKLFKAKDAAVDLVEIQADISDELATTNASYGDNIVSLKKLASAWKALKTEAEKMQWLKDNKSEFNKLGVEVNNIVDAETAFVTNTQDVLDALKLRARAAAATKLAAEKYEEALIKQAELEKLPTKGPSFGDYAEATIKGSMAGSPAAGFGVLLGTDLAQEIKQLNNEADAFFEVANAAEAAANAKLAGLGLYFGEGKNGKGRSVADLLNNEERRAQKNYETSQTNLEREEFIKRRKAAEASYNDKVKAAENANEKLTRILKNEDKDYRNLTDAQKKQAQDTIEVNKKAIESYAAEYKKALEDIAKDETIFTVKHTLATQKLKLKTLKGSSKDEFQLRREILENEKALALAENAKLPESQRQDPELIAKEYAQMLEDIAKEEEIFGIEHTIKMLELKLKTIKEGSDEEFQLRQQILEKQKQLALAENAKLPPSQRQDPNLIKQGYAKESDISAGTRFMEVFDQQQALEDARFNAVVHSEYEITRHRLAQERHRWNWLIALAETGGLDWTQAQIDAAKATVEGINREIGRLDKQNNFMGKVAEYGLFGALFAGWGSKKGMDDQQIQDAIAGFNTFANSVISNLQAILQAEVEYAERMKELADERVDAAQKAYDAEIEGRNNGYAHNVATAKKELEQEKKNQQQKQRLLEEAQRRQEALNTISQASSLVTASAQLWQAFSSIPFVGPALALAAIATMWGSFTAAKVKARQVTASSEEYGEGGLEFLEGGSHASGNDIDLGVNNSRNRRMRAEGGEALAIINKRNTRRYKGILPDVIDSFNKGTFEDKYLNAFGSLPNSYFIGMKSNTDLTRLEAEVAKIRKQGEAQYFLGADGTIIELKGNVKRIIKS